MSIRVGKKEVGPKESVDSDWTLDEDHTPFRMSRCPRGNSLVVKLLSIQFLMNIIKDFRTDAIVYLGHYVTEFVVYVLKRECSVR